ncbi:hypothetical protein ACCC88_17980 [Sphingomonas sp. Sphisp140]
MSILVEILFQICVESAAWVIERRFGATGCLVVIGALALIVVLLLRAF